MKFSQQLNTHNIVKRLAKALISLRVCAGWSEPLLVAHTTLLEISCCGSNIYMHFAQWAEMKSKIHPNSETMKTFWVGGILLGSKEVAYKHFSNLGLIHTSFRILSESSPYFLHKERILSRFFVEF